MNNTAKTLWALEFTILVHYIICGMYMKFGSLNE